MRIGFYTDLHWTSNSSIIRNRGKKYSVRLENCIRTVNWVEDLFKQSNVDMVVFGGDFFDHNHLTAEEITALNDLVFYDQVNHYFIVGNHEITNANALISSMHLFNNYPFIKVVDEPMSVDGVAFIPYIVEANRKSFKEYIGDSKVVFSHNDIKGINFGGFINETGFDVNEIKENCSLFINGHLHNGQFLNEEETILNLGNITGQNFGEDASKYNHQACIVDTETMKISFYSNPFAYNFYKLDLTQSKEYEVKNNAVVTIRVKENEANEVKQIISQDSKILTSRMIIVANDNTEIVEDIEFNSVDHLKLLKEFVMSKLENTSVLKEEINKILGE